MTPNFPLLIQSLRQATNLAMTGQFDLDNIVDGLPDYSMENPVSCGAICCVVGLAVVLPDFPSKGYHINWFGDLRDPDGYGANYKDAGAAIFDIDRAQAFWLFRPKENGCTSNSLTEYQLRLQNFCDYYGQPWPADIPRI